MESNRSGVVPLNQIMDMMRERKAQSKRQDLAVMESVVSLPAITARRVTSTTAQAAPTAPNTARPDYMPQPWKAPRPQLFKTTGSLDSRLRAAATAAVRSAPPTAVPPKYFSYKTAFDVDNAEEAQFAEYDFTASESHHLTYKIPVFPSVSQVTTDGSSKSVSKPFRSLRPEVRYLAQVADHMYASVATMNRDDPFTDTTTNELIAGRNSDEGFGESCLVVKKTAFVLNEAARLIAPTCFELSELLLAVKLELERVPNRLAASRKAVVEAKVTADSLLVTQADTIAIVSQQVERLKRELEAVKEAQVSEAQRFVQQITAMGLKPEIHTTDPYHAPRPMFSVEQINALSGASQAYAFSAERVVAGKKFVKHPPITREIAVDCTDLFFDVGLTRLPPPEPQPKALQFRGKTFVQAVHRILDGSETADALRKRGLQLTEVPEDEAPFETSPVTDLEREASEGHLLAPPGGSFAKRRQSVNFKKKVSLLTKASKLMLATSGAGSSTTNSGDASPAVAASNSAAGGSFVLPAQETESPSKASPPKKSNLLKISTLAALATAQVQNQTKGATNNSPTLQAATSFRRGASVEKTDMPCQTECSYLGTTCCDASVQVVEADIARKAMRKSGRAINARSESLNVTPRPPGSATGRSDSRTQDLPPSAGVLPLPPSGDALSIDGPNAVVLDAPLWRASFVEGLGEPLRSPLMPFESAAVGVNTDITLTGFDATPLTFLDAVKLRYMPPVDTDNDPAYFDSEASSIKDGHVVGGRRPHGGYRRQSTTAAAATVLPSQSSQKGGPAGTSSAPELPEDIASVFGLKTTDNYRQHTLAWLNALALELLKHIDPFKMVQQGKPLPVWAFAHFRAKYGLGKMATTYCLDFLGNLKLHHLGSIRAHLLISWLGLREFAGLSPSAPYITSETLYVYVIAVLNIARSGTHKTLKDFDTAELLLPPQRIEALCDALLRNVATSMDNADEWTAVRTSWHNVLINTAQMPPTLRRLCDEIQAARGKPGSLDALPKTADDSNPFPRNVSLDADVLLLLIVVNYQTLRDRLITRATMLRQHAAAVTSSSVGFNDAGELVESTVPPLPMIVSNLACWPVEYVAPDVTSAARESAEM